MTRRTVNIPLSFFGDIPFDTDIHDTDYHDQIIEKAQKKWCVRWYDDKATYDYNATLTRFFSGLLPSVMIPHYTVTIANEGRNTPVATAYQKPPLFNDFLDNINHYYYACADVNEKLPEVLALLIFLNQSVDCVSVMSLQGDVQLQVANFDLKKNLEIDFEAINGCFISPGDIDDVNLSANLQLLDQDQAFYSRKMLMLLILAYVPLLPELLGMRSSDESAHILIERQKLLRQALLSSNRLVNWIDNASTKELNECLKKIPPVLKEFVTADLNKIKKLYLNDLRLMQEQRSVFLANLMTLRDAICDDIVALQQSVLDDLVAVEKEAQDLVRQKQLLNAFGYDRQTLIAESLLSQSRLQREWLFESSVHELKTQCERMQFFHVYQNEWSFIVSEALFSTVEIQRQLMFDVCVFEQESLRQEFQKQLIQQIENEFIEKNNFYQDFLFLFAPDLVVMRFLKKNKNEAGYYVSYTEHFQKLRQFEIKIEDEEALKSGLADLKRKFFANELELDGVNNTYLRESRVALKKKMQEIKICQYQLKECVDQLGHCENPSDDYNQALVTKDTLTAQLEKLESEKKDIEKSQDTLLDKRKALIADQTENSEVREALLEKIHNPFALHNIKNNKSLNQKIADMFAISYFLNISCLSWSVVWMNGIEQIKLVDFDCGSFDASLQYNEDYIALCDKDNQAVIDLVKVLNRDHDFLRHKMYKLLIIALTPNIASFFGEGISHTMLNALEVRQQQLREILLSSSNTLINMLNRQYIFFTVSSQSDIETPIIDYIVSAQSRSEFHQRSVNVLREMVNFNGAYVAKLFDVSVSDYKKRLYESLEVFLFGLLQRTLHEYSKENYSRKHFFGCSFSRVKFRMGLMRFFERYPLLLAGQGLGSDLKRVDFLNMLLISFGARGVDTPEFRLLFLIEKLHELPHANHIHAVLTDNHPLMSSDKKYFIANNAHGECPLFSSNGQVSKVVHSPSFVLRAMVLLVEEVDCNDVSVLRHKDVIASIYNRLKNQYLSRKKNKTLEKNFNFYAKKFDLANTAKEFSKLLMDIVFQLTLPFAYLFLKEIISYAFCEIHMARLIEYFHIYGNEKIHNENQFVDQVLDLQVSDTDVEFFYGIMADFVKRPHCRQGWTASQVMDQMNEYANLAPAPQPPLPIEKPRSSSSFVDSVSSFFRSSGVASAGVQAGDGAVSSNVTSASGTLSSLMQKGVEMAPEVQKTAKDISSTVFSALGDWWSQKPSGPQ